MRYGIPLLQWFRWLKCIFAEFYHNGVKCGYKPWRSRITGRPGPFYYFHFRKERHFMSCLPNRFGKDYSNAAEAGALVFIPGKHIIFAGSQLKFSIITFDWVMNFILPLLIEKKIPYKLSRSTKPYIVLYPDSPNPSYIKCESFKNLGALEGIEIDLCVICEAGDPHTSFQWMIEKLPTRLMNRHGSVVVQSTNDARNPDFRKFIMANKDFDNTLYIGKESSNRYFTEWTAYDSPFIPEDEIELNKIRLPEKIFAEKFLGDFVSLSGLCLQSFRPQHIISHSDISFIDWFPRPKAFAGVDFGANDKTVITVGIPFKGKWYLVDEYVTQDEAITKVLPYAQALRDKWDIEMFFCDHQKQTWLEFTEYGLPACAAFKRPVFDSVVALDVSFYRDEVFVCRNCENFIDESKSYMWSDKANVPIDKDNHSIDSARYLVDSQERDSGPVQLDFSLLDQI